MTMTMADIGLMTHADPGFPATWLSRFLEETHESARNLAFERKSVLVIKVLCLRKGDVAELQQWIPEVSAFLAQLLDGESTFTVTRCSCTSTN
jgi:hypothetical protein